MLISRESQSDHHGALLHIIGPLSGLIHQCCTATSLIIDFALDVFHFMYEIISAVVQGDNVCFVSVDFVHQLALKKELELELQLHVVDFLNHCDHISQSDPSSLHQINGCAITIQFHHGIIGESQGGGISHNANAGHQKHIASQIAQVNVGVTNILKKFSGFRVHNNHQADIHGHIGQGIKANGVTGHTIGKQQGTNQHIICIQVKAEKIGKPAVGCIKFGVIGIQKIVTELHGASGAQFNGIAIHHHQPNQQPNPLTKSSI